jgi:putative acetyltransferase
LGRETIKIRRAQSEDARGIMLVHSRSIREICGKNYSPEQITAWSAYLSKESLWQQKIERDYLWVIEDQSQILGFSHLAIMNLELGEILGLYLLPEIKGQGQGKKLMEVILEESHKQRLCYLTLLSTLTAKTFYEKQGFYQSDPDTTISINGADIEGIPMTKVLS